MAAGQRRQQRLLHRVLGRAGIAQLQAGEAQQVGAQGIELALAIRVHGVHRDERLRIFAQHRELRQTQSDL
jgi:hypothetical protein